MNIVTKIGTDIDRVTIYKMTDQFRTRAKLSDMAGQLIAAKHIVLYEDENNAGELQKLTAIDTGETVLVSNSRTVYDSVAGMYAAFGDDMLSYNLLVKDGTSKNGRKYIWLEMYC